MKTKYFLIYVIICFTTILSNTQDKHTKSHEQKNNTRQGNKQPQSKKKNKADTYVTEEMEIENALVAPIKFTTDGVKGFLRHAYNKPEYCSDVLPNNLSHFLQFLIHGKKTKQTRAYVKSVFKLFGNKLKACPCINAYTFSAMLEKLPDILDEYFIITRMDSLDKYKTAINDILYANFLAKYDMFRKHTHDFFDALSTEILDSLHSDIALLNENVSAIELRQSLMRFLEIGTSKLVWSPEDHASIWDSVKTISKQFEALMDTNIIDDANELDDLYWSLIHRFCFFIDVAGQQLPITFFEKVKNEIATEQLLLLELEEQEPVLEAKSKWLMRAVLEGQARKEAAEHGLVLS